MTETRKVHAGISILIERIKTNPDEFYPDEHAFNQNSAWDILLERYRECLDKEDWDAWNNAKREAMQQKLTEEILERITWHNKADERNKEVRLPRFNTTPYTQTLSVPTTASQHSYTIANNIPMQQDEAEKQEMIKALKELMAENKRRTK